MTTSLNAQRIVLVALDGSPAAATALPIAHALAVQLGATIAILHIAAAPLSETDLRQRLSLNRPDAEALQIQAVVGEPAAEIVRAASAPGVVLVVLTTHGQGRAGGRRLGRVAEVVVASSTSPILLVRPEAVAKLETGAMALRRLLLPLDGAPTTAMALRAATALAARLGASVDLLYVADPRQLPPIEPGSIGVPYYIDQPQHEWPHWTSEVVERMCMCCADCPPGVPIQMFLSRGEVGAEIARFAAAHREDAIVLVRRSRLEPGHARVLRAVLAEAPCPVLIVGGQASR